MNHQMRLGPMAIFLAVIAVVLSMLAILTTATTNADAALASRFAQVTAVRGILEKEGHLFLKAYDAQVRSGTPDPEAVGAVQTEDGYIYSVEKDGYTLNITVSAPDDAGNYKVIGWKIKKQWEEANPFNDIWMGDGL